MQTHVNEGNTPEPRRDPYTEQLVSGFISNLADLQETGLPLLRSLRILEHSAPASVLKQALRNVLDEVEGGSSLSEAIAKHPSVFQPVVVKMITVGEVGGVLDLCLKGLSELLDFVPPTLREGRISDITPEGRTFLMSLGTMVGAGVPILEAIKVAGDCSDPEVKAMAIRAHDEVRNGGSFVEGLRGEGDNRHFGPVTMAMLDVGEETGEFDRMCLKAATR